MKIVLTVNSKDYERHKLLIQSLGGEIIATKLEQMGFCENPNLITYCKVPKKNLKNFLKKS